MNTTQFLEQMKIRCQQKAKQMAKIELTVADTESYKSELKQHFGFTDKRLAIRKKELLKTANQ